MPDTTFRRPAYADRIPQRAACPERPRRSITSLLPACAMAAGTLSVATFWMTGLGIVLGISGLAAGITGVIRHRAEDDESASLWSLLGILAANLGLTTSAVAMVAGLPSI
jgi:hypothetical protein